MQVRLLIVEDSEGMVEIMKRFMRPICSFITSTGDLADAVEMARIGKFNLIILDLNLHATGKAEAFHAIRELKSFNTSVLVVSGIPDLHLKEDALAAGADGFIPKSGDFTANSLMMAANIATLHLPRESFHSDSFTQHIALLRQTVAA